jgi:protein O-mannosyl-transferase
VTDPDRSAAPAARTSSTIRLALLAAIVVTISAAAFLPTLGGGFVNWDDDVNFTTNPGFRGLGPAQLRWMFTTTLTGHWIPLTWLTLGANYALGGMDPWGYHLVNVLVHAAAAGVFFLVARRLLAAALGGSALVVDLGAAFAALVFGAHPLRVESVAWITERRDVLCALFYMLTVLAYLRGVEGGQILAGRWRALAVAAFAASLLSKSMSMTLPASLLVLDLYPLRRLGLGWRRLLWEKTPFAVLGGLGAVGALLSQNRGATWTGLEAYGIPARLAMTAYSFWFYPWKFVWPSSLSPLYELPLRVDPLAPRFLGPMVAVISISLVLLALRRRWPAGLAAWAHSLIVLLPVSGLVHTGYQLAHDRYSYLSGLGLALLVGGGLVWALGQRARGRMGAPVAAAVVGAACVAVAGLATSAWQQSRIWHDSESLWVSAITVDPNCMLCWNNLGHAMLARGAHVDAERFFTRAIWLRPSRPGPWNNLGTALALQHRYREAEAPYAKALELSGGAFREAVSNLGRLYAVEERYADAIPLLRRANAMRPDTPEVVASLRVALKNQGGALAAAGRPAEAEALFREALDLGDEQDLYINLGRARLDQGRAADAIAPLERAVQMNPRHAHARAWLTRAYALAGARERAADAMAALTTLDPALAARVASEIPASAR